MGIQQSSDSWYNGLFVTMFSTQTPGTMSVGAFG